MSGFGIYNWTHHDAKLGQHALDGLWTAEAGAFQRGGEDPTVPGTVVSDAELVARFRGLLVFSALNQARLVGTVTLTPLSSDTQRLDLDLPQDELVPSPDELVRERTEAAHTLRETWRKLAGDGFPPTVFSTSADETAAIPAGVVVVGIIVVGAALCYLGHRSLETIDRQLARDAQAKALLQKHAAAERIIDQHLEREAAAGKPLPLDDASKTVLDQLGQLQRDATPTAPPNPEPSGREWNTLAWVVGAAIVAAVAAPALSKVKL